MERLMDEKPGDEKPGRELVFGPVVPEKNQGRELVFGPLVLEKNQGRELVFGPLVLEKNQGRELVFRSLFIRWFENSVDKKRRDEGFRLKNAGLQENLSAFGTLSRCLSL